MSNIESARLALLKRILEGNGKARLAERRAALDNAGSLGVVDTVVNKVAKQAYRVTDDDIVAAKTSGLSEDQIFELVVCASVGQANRQYDTAMAALEAASGRK